MGNYYIVKKPIMCVGVDFLWDKSKEVLLNKKCIVPAIVRGDYGIIMIHDESKDLIVQHTCFSDYLEKIDITKMSQKELEEYIIYS